MKRKISIDITQQPPGCFFIFNIKLVYYPTICYYFKVIITQNLVKKIIPSIEQSNVKNLN